MEMRRFLFVKDYKENNLNIKEGTELRLFRGLVYLNGGMIVPAYQKLLMTLVQEEDNNPNYLLELDIIKDKV